MNCSTIRHGRYFTGFTSSVAIILSMTTLQYDTINQEKPPLSHITILYYESDTKNIGKRNNTYNNIVISIKLIESRGLVTSDI